MEIDDAMSGEEGLSSEAVLYLLWEEMDDSLSRSAIGDMIDSEFKFEDEDELVSEITDRVVENLSQRYDSDFNDFLGAAMDYIWRERGYRRGFEYRLYQRWQYPLDLLEILIHISLHIGSGINSEHRRSAAEDDDFQFDALMRLHSRACQTSYEILELLKSGFADGAYARWRSLHESAVISLFLAQHDQETAERFLLYSTVENYYEMEAYDEHSDELGYEPLSDEMMDEIEEAYQALSDRFGSSFTGFNGWAVHQFSGGSVRFVDIEEKVGLDYLRPHYKAASNWNVHIGSKGMQHRVGMLDDGGVNQPLLSGPSNYGLADPGQCTAISLCQVTDLLMDFDIDREFSLLFSIIEILEAEIAASFVAAQDQIKAEEGVNE